MFQPVPSLPLERLFSLIESVYVGANTSGLSKSRQRGFQFISELREKPYKIRTLTCMLASEPGLLKELLADSGVGFQDLIQYRSQESALSMQLCTRLYAEEE